MGGGPPQLFGLGGPHLGGGPRHFLDELLDDDDLDPLLPDLPDEDELLPQLGFHQSPLLLELDDLDPDLPDLPLDDDELDDPHLDGGLPHPPPL